MQRGTCSFADKVSNAALAGAAGALVFNNVPVPPLIFGTTTIPFIPAMNLTQALGLQLALLDSPIMHMQVTLPDVVPEPSTLGLIALGLLGLGAMRRHHGKRQVY
jgi:hypothetical protein